MVEVAAHGSTFLRLWFSGGAAPSPKEVLLFMNDSTGGQNEECYLFRVRASNLATNDH
jgi:hypothetical protein